MCEVEEVKGGVHMAWCYECGDYASEENYFPGMMADYVDALRKQERENEGGKRCANVSQE